jgi:antitoxin MazE
MKIPLIRIGNSQGIRIPKMLIEQCGLGSTVEIIVEDNRLTISPVKKVRHGWEEAFKKMTENGDDQLLIDDAIAHDWDDNWQW